VNISWLPRRGKIVLRKDDRVDGLNDYLGF
jgi:hypothetical protein